MIKISFNGQWILAKSEGPDPTSLHGLIGKNHTVEVHPHMDHLYRLKNLIQKAPGGQMSISDIKKTEFGHFADKFKGSKVTPEMVDKHIANLPKKKLEIKVVPYEMKAQQHRQHVPEYTVSVGLHPDTLKGMSTEEAYTWNKLKNDQHDLRGHEHQVGWARIDPYKHNENQKLVPNDGHWHIDEIQSDFGGPKKLDEKIKNITSANSIYGKIKSHMERQVEAPQNLDLYPDYVAGENDFSQVYPELAHHISSYTKAKKGWTEAHRKALENSKGKEYLEAMRNIDEKFKKDNQSFYDEARQVATQKAKEATEQVTSGKNLHKMLSHGHEDPMHMIHSAVNELGRKNGIKSMSMDMPKHQAHQSSLRPSNENDFQSDNSDEKLYDYIQGGNISNEDANHLWDMHGQQTINNQIHDIDFKSVYDKLGPEGLKSFAHLVPTDFSSWLFNGNNDSEHWNDMVKDGGIYSKHFSPEVLQALQKMTPREKDALSRFANSYSHPVLSTLHDNLDLGEDKPELENIDQYEYDLPVHQVNTYDKRPKKLGFKPMDKEAILGPDENDPYEQVQFANLAKNLKHIRDLLKKA